MSDEPQASPSITGRVWRHARALTFVGAVLIAFVVGFSMRGGGTTPSSPRHDHGAGAADQEYTCSMHPQVRMPGADDKCPICFMDLIPVSSSSASGGLGPREIELSAQAVALIDVQTTPVTRRRIAHRVEMVGGVEYDETRLAYITAYVPGRMDRMFVDFTGIRVRENDHLAEIYSPDLLVARQELIEARRSLDRLSASSSEIAREAGEAVIRAARERLRLLGLTPQQIHAVEADPQASGNDHITLFAPIGGVVIEKHAKPGSYVEEGDRIYTIADLSKVWVVLEAYESDLPWLRYGQPVEFTAQPFGDEVFTGHIAFIDSVVDPAKRTVRVRVNVENPDGRLRPGLLVRAGVTAEVADAGRVIAPELAGKWVSPMHPEVVSDTPGDCPVCGMDLVRAEELGYAVASIDAHDMPLVVPDSAVLRTGRRGVVYVQTQGGDAPRFEGRVVEIGPRGEGFVSIRSGLVEGDLVVTRGNFQIDSALQIQAKPSMMNPDGGETPNPHAGHGQHATGQAAPQQVVHVGGEGAAALRELVAVYLGFTQALAAADLAAADAAVADLQDKALAVEAAPLPDAVRQLWSDQRARLDEAHGHLTNASGLEGLRQGLGPLSDALVALTQGTRVEAMGPLYQAHCPMALGPQGAFWLTKQDQVVNPYFGDQMLRCGTIEQTLSTPTPGSAPASENNKREGGHSAHPHHGHHHE